MDDLRSVVSELLRVLRPGGRLMATVGVARDRDWFHEPSQGWCFTKSTLRSIFQLAPDCPSNFTAYDQLMKDLRDCEELRYVDSLEATSGRSPTACRGVGGIRYINPLGW